MPSANSSSRSRASGKEYVLILAGDHLYRMDYQEMVEFHWENQADITVAVQPVAANEASRFGLLKRDAGLPHLLICRKPHDPEVLAQFVSRDDPLAPYLGSMGIYIFNTELLFSLLEGTLRPGFRQPDHPQRSRHVPGVRVQI